MPNVVLPVFNMHSAIAVTMLGINCASRNGKGSGDE